MKMIMKLVGAETLINGYIALGYKLPRRVFKSPISKGRDPNFDTFPES